METDSADILCCGNVHCLGPNGVVYILCRLSEADASSGRTSALTVNRNSDLPQVFDYRWPFAERTKRSIRGVCKFEV